MTPQIVLVSEAPGSHDQVVRSLAAAGFQVVPQATLRAAVSLLRDAENAVLAMVLDVPLFSSIDADVLADLTVQHPRLRMMVFAWRGRQQEALRRIESCPQISTFSTPLGERTSPGLILKALAEAITPGAPGAMLTKVRRSLRRLRARSVRTPARSYQPTRTWVIRSMMMSSCAGWGGPMFLSCCMVKPGRARRLWRESYGPTRIESASLS